eukprot:9207529-Karenia_brevis.AAC.1
MITPEFAPPTHVHYTPVLAQTPGHALKLACKVDQKMMDKHLDSAPPVIQGFHKLMIHTTYHKTPVADYPGVTWLELLLLSLAASGKHDETLGTNVARKRKSIKLTLQQFICQVREHISFAYDTSTA